MDSRSVATRESWTGRQHDFAVIPDAQIPRSKFNRSHGHRTTFDSGYLVPIFSDEALPGDTFTLRCHSFTRMTTPVFPVMDNIYQDYFFFAVPVRLIWENFNRFMGEQPNPGDSTAFVVPQFVAGVVDQGTLSDYLGIPPCGGAGQPATLTFNSLWHRAYNLIWNEWFRDENLQDRAVVDVDDGPDTLSDYVIRRRGKRHDYFTSCLPFTQKGTAVSLPLGTTAPVVPSGTGIPTMRTDGVGGTARSFGTVAASAVLDWSGTQPGSGVAEWVAPALEVNLAAATAATINQIREAFQVQRLLERDARGGTRYTEIIRAHFGVVSPDSRLQRPEYLGGGSTRINMHPVARTTGVAASGAADVGAYAKLGAFATASIDSVGFHKSFSEHCLIIGLVQVRADLTYQQGVERMFSRRTRYDYYWPAFAHLGEQAVYNNEIYAVPGAAVDSGVFGYQERFAEYRYKPSRTSGRFRSQDATPLDVWHLGIEFGSAPLLNDAFIQDDSPFNRVIVTITEPQFLGDFWFEFGSVRPMPTYGVPGLIDHF